MGWWWFERTFHTFGGFESSKKWWTKFLISSLKTLKHWASRKTESKAGIEAQEMRCHLDFEAKPQVDWTRNHDSKTDILRDATRILWWMLLTSSLRSPTPRGHQNGLLHGGSLWHEFRTGLGVLWPEQFQPAVLQALQCHGCGDGEFWSG